MTLQLSHMSSRNQLGKDFADRGFKGRGVEIGTHRGEFAKCLLDAWNPGGVLMCVDPWELQSEEYATTQAQFLPDTAGDRRKDRHKAERVLTDHCQTGRCVISQRDSAVAARLFPQESPTLDFVYLDGDHSYSGVCQDIALWWPRISPGGVLSGHDFLCPGPAGNPENWGRFIQPAILSFANVYKMDVYLIAEENNLPWSWYVEKPL